MDDFKTLPALWVTGLGGMPPSVRLKVRSLAASDFGGEVERRCALIPPAQAVALGKKRLVALALAVAVDVALERLLVDWSNVVVAGEPVPFSRARAREMMTNDGMLRAAVIAAAARLDDDRVPGHVAAGMA